jgi:hypothetical protein
MALEELKLLALENPEQLKFLSRFEMLYLWVLHGL